MFFIVDIGMVKLNFLAACPVDEGYDFYGATSLEVEKNREKI